MHTIVGIYLKKKLVLLFIRYMRSLGIFSQLTYLCAIATRIYKPITYRVEKKRF